MRGSGSGRAASSRRGPPAAMRCAHRHAPLRWSPRTLQHFMADLLSTVQQWIDAAERGRRPHRRRHLDRFRHPRFPRPEGRVDEEPRGREAVDDPALPGRPGGPQGAWRSRLDHSAWSAKPNAGHRALVELERRGKLHALITQNIDELHQLAGHSPETRDRGARHDAPGDVLELRLARADGGGAGARARGRGRPALPQLRRHPEERHHLVRPGAGAGSDRARDGTPRPRPTCCCRSARTLQVYPVARRRAASPSEAGARVVIVNAQPTPIDELADAVLREPIGEVLPAICAAQLGCRRP